jgi:hypothetical protein
MRIGERGHERPVVESSVSERGLGVVWVDRADMYLFAVV